MNIKVINTIFIFTERIFRNSLRKYSINICLNCLIEKKNCDHIDQDDCANIAGLKVL